MPIVKLKYVGTGETNLTVDNVYTALAIVLDSPQPKAIIINDLGVPYVTGRINLTSEWLIESVNYIDCINL